MGTLTVGQQRLPGFCEHKLPTSCRLSSILNCCACADERAHAASYRTYIDGIGFVPRGTRWQRYCWFCREFWENRVEASGLRPGQTRIPLVPDQTEFLARWYDFHRGYRIVTAADGSEMRVAMLGENLRDVSPGCLPRTLDELRAGRERSEALPSLRQSQPPEEEHRPSGPSLDETLDQLFHDASTEEAARQRPPTDASEPRSRRVAALRRELHRLEAGLESVKAGLREMGETVPDASEANRALAQVRDDLDAMSIPPSREGPQRAINSVDAPAPPANASRNDRTLAGLQERVEQATSLFATVRQRRSEAIAEREAAQTAFATAREALNQARRDQRSAENYMRTFGTREEMAQQGENYVSPITNMFGRAYERFNAAEAVRREARILRPVLDDEDSAGGPSSAAVLSELVEGESDVWSVPRSQDLAAEVHSEVPPLVSDASVMNQQPMPEHTRDYELERSQEFADPFGEALAQDGITAQQLNQVATSRWTEDVDDRPALIPAHQQNQTAEYGLAEDVDNQPVSSGPRKLLSIPFHNQRAWRLCAEYLLNTLLMNERYRTERIAGLDLSVDKLATLYHDLIGEDFDRGSKDDIDQLLMHFELMWRCGVPMFYAKRLLYDDVKEQPVRGIMEEWCSATGRMAIAYMASAKFREATGNFSDREKENALRRLERGEQQLSDLSIIHFLIDRRGGRDQAETILLDSTPEDWFLKDAEIVVDCLIANNDLQAEFARLVTPVQLLELVSDITFATQKTAALDDANVVLLHTLLGNDDLVWRSGIPAQWLERQKLSRSRYGGSILFDQASLDAMGLTEAYHERAQRVNPLLKLELARQAWIADATNPGSALRTRASNIDDYGLLSDQLLSGELNDFIRDRLERLWAAESLLICAILGVSPSASQISSAAQSSTYTQPVAVLAANLALQTSSSQFFAHHDDNDIAIWVASHGGTGSLNRQQADRFAAEQRWLSRQNVDDVSTGSELADAETDTERQVGLDAPDSGRPGAKSEDEMRKVLECRICYTQVADVACLPCGHLVMCAWCSEEHSPTSPHDRTRPLGHASCPVCRKKIRNKVKVFPP